jgi:outer membrane biosynthesis protein TonB
MNNKMPIALAVVLLTIAAACHKDNKEAQLKALDNAYKSGVFTKEEYDAKKQALMGPPPAAPAAPAASPATPPEPPPPETAAAPPAAPAPAQPPAAQTPPPYSPAPRSAVAPKAPSAPQIPAAPPVSAPQIPAPPPQAQAAPPSRAAEPDEPEPAPMAGCQDAESRAGGPKGVQERFFPASEEAVRNAAALAFDNLDFTIHSDSGHQMEASKRRHLSAVVGAGGERLILHFSSAQQGGQRGTRVTGETKKSIVGRLAQKSWTSAVLAQIACNLRTARH